MALPQEQRGLPAWCARLCMVITVLTVQGIPETAAASLRGDAPGTIEPGRRVTDMLLVSTFQARHPILSLILMKTMIVRCTVTSQVVWHHEGLRLVEDGDRCRSRGAW